MKKTKLTPQEPLAAKVLESMPGLIGAINMTFRDQVKEEVAFVLVAFVAGTAVHATNIVPASGAMVALRALVEGMDDVAGAVSH